MGRLLMCCVALCLTLTACARPPEIVERPVYIVADVPSRLRYCAPLPTSPAADLDATQSDVAAYLVRLHQVAADCRGKLFAVDAILDAAESSAQPSPAPTTRETQAPAVAPPVGATPSPGASAPEETISTEVDANGAVG